MKRVFSAVNDFYSENVLSNALRSVCLLAFLPLTIRSDVLVLHNLLTVA